MVAGVFFICAYSQAIFLEQKIPIVSAILWVAVQVVQ